MDSLSGQSCCRGLLSCPKKLCCKGNHIHTSRRLCRRWLFCFLRLRSCWLLRPRFLLFVQPSRILWCCRSWNTILFFRRNKVDNNSLPQEEVWASVRAILRYRWLLRLLDRLCYPLYFLWLRLCFRKHYLRCWFFRPMAGKEMGYLWRVKQYILPPYGCKHDSILSGYRWGWNRARK